MKEEQPQEDRSVFSLPKISAPETIYYGGDKENNCADFFRSTLDKNNHLIILIHGGYWKPEINREYFRPYAAALMNKGYSTLSIEYRRILGNPDVYIQDTLNAINTIVNQLNTNFDKVILIGHSVGGYLALHSQLILKEKINKSILLAPVLNLQKTQDLKICDDVVTNYLGQSADNRRDLDPFYLPFPSGDTVIIQGDIDLRVPAILTQEYMEKYKNDNTIVQGNIKYIELKNIGHFEIVNPNFEELFNIVIEEIEKIK